MKRGFIHANLWKDDRDAFLIEEGRFIKIGTSAGIEKMLGKEDGVIDLRALLSYRGLSTATCMF